MIGKIKSISRNNAIDFLEDKHYSGRKPVTSYCYGWFIGDTLSAVCTFGKPASNNLCIGVCGKEYSHKVYELNRLCAVDGFAEQLSCFVSACLRRLKNVYGLIIVSYADTDMGHNGYIYQACNFIYTGMTKKRTDKYTEGNKHSRHYDKNDDNTLRKVRSAKHRYIFFAMDRREKKKALKNLNYSICEYPKGDNERYVLGDFLKPKIVSGKGGSHDRPR